MGCDKLQPKRRSVTVSSTASLKSLWRGLGSTHTEILQEGLWRRASITPTPAPYHHYRTPPPPNSTGPYLCFLKLHYVTFLLARSFQWLGHICRQCWWKVISIRLQIKSCHTTDVDYKQKMMVSLSHFLPQRPGEGVSHFAVQTPQTPPPSRHTASPSYAESLSVRRRVSHPVSVDGTLPSECFHTAVCRLLSGRGLI